MDWRLCSKVSIETLKEILVVGDSRALETSLGMTR
jgi:hypothetical protein